MTNRANHNPTTPPFTPARTPVIMAATLLCFTQVQAQGQAVTTNPPSAGSHPTAAPQAGRELTHEQTLAWVHEHRAWRQARKTRPIWAREVTPQEINKEFQTADRAIEKARAGAWLCVGVAHEPWFQEFQKIEAKYRRAGQETRQFEFDDRPHTYAIYEPKPDARVWAAQVPNPNIANPDKASPDIASPDIAGFSIRPGYDPATPLHSPAGGYVVKGDCPDPYQDAPDDVWLVQQNLFESTYEFTSDK